MMSRLCRGVVIVAIESRCDGVYRHSSKGKLCMRHYGCALKTPSARSRKTRRETVLR